MIYYKEKIPDLELCKLHMENEEIDDSTREIRNDYATKMLILFYPFQQIKIIISTIDMDKSSP